MTEASGHHGCVRQGVRGCRGFTLVETMVCTGIIGVLLAVSLVALARSRKSGDMVHDLAQVRTLLQLLDMYAGSQDDLYPITEANPFSNCVMWSPALKRLGLMENARTDACIGAQGPGGHPDACLSICMSYSPEFMKPGHTVPDGEARSSPVRHSQVASPALKGVMMDADVATVQGGIDYWCCEPELPGPVGFADGSAELGVWTQYLPSGVYRVIDRIGHPVVSTWDGYLGRDR